MVKRQVAKMLGGIVEEPHMVFIHPDSGETLAEEIDGVACTLEMYGIVDLLDLCIQNDCKSGVEKQKSKQPNVSKLAAKPSAPPPPPVAAPTSKPSAPPAPALAASKFTTLKAALPSSSQKAPGSVQRAPQPAAEAGGGAAEAGGGAAASRSPLPKGMHVDPRNDSVLPAGLSGSAGKTGHSKKFWALPETQALLEGLRVFNKDWVRIKKYFSHQLSIRSNVDMKDRWRALERGHNSKWQTERRSTPDFIKTMVRCYLSGDYKDWPVDNPPLTERDCLEMNKRVTEMQSRDQGGEAGPSNPNPKLNPDPFDI